MTPESTTRAAPPLSETVDSREAVRRTGHSVRTLERYADRGFLTKYHTPGGRVRWAVAELDNLLSVGGAS